MKRCASPLRKCVGCNEMKDKASLIRVVRLDGKAIIDFSGKGQGRGAYICRNRECLMKVTKRNGFSRALKVRVGDELYQELTGVIENADNS